MKSTLKNMVLTLTVITLISSALLGFIYSLTKEPIEKAKGAKTVEALSGVLPQFDNDPTQDTVSYVINGQKTIVYKGLQNGQPTGYAVQTTTQNGFSGEIGIMVGFKPEGEIYNIEVLQHSETPGLGSKMTEPGNVLLVSFQGKNPAELNMTVRKDGGDIDALTASTITSRAYAEAVTTAYEAFQAVTTGTVPVNEVPDPFEEINLEYDNEIETTGEVLSGTGYEATIYSAYMNEEPTGYAILASSGKGFNGPITLLAGFDMKGILTGISVVEQSETPGYGAVIKDTDNSLAEQLTGKDLRKVRLRIKNDGGDVDAISGSTITSQAYLDALGKAAEALKTKIR